jgi:hypothetical protein
VLPLLALLIVFAGTAISGVLVLTAGRRNHSIFLRVIFLVWVLLPFISMVVVFLISGQWVLSSQRRACWLVLVLSVCSLFAYIDLPGIAGTRPALVFLVTPAVTDIILILTAISLSKNKFSRDN